MVVGMNSIVMYVMAQLIPGWVSQMLKIHLTMLDTAIGTNVVYYLYDPQFAYAVILEYAARLFILWLICYWLYRRRLFVRI
jgi:predicted acyltransferase